MISDKQAAAECRQLVSSGAAEWLIARAKAQAFSMFEAAETADQAWSALLLHRTAGNMEQIIKGAANLRE